MSVYYFLGQPPQAKATTLTEHLTAESGQFTQSCVCPASYRGHFSYEFSMSVSSNVSTGMEQARRNGNVCHWTSHMMMMMMNSLNRGQFILCYRNGRIIIIIIISHHIPPLRGYYYYNPHTTAPYVLSSMQYKTAQAQVIQHKPLYA